MFLSDFIAFEEETSLVLRIFSAELVYLPFFPAGIDSFWLLMCLFNRTIPKRVFFFQHSQNCLGRGKGLGVAEISSTSFCRKLAVAIEAQ